MVASALLFVALVLAPGPTPARGATGAELCAEETVVDFEKPFEGMPADRPPPEGELPFGPRNLSMFRLGWDNVALERHRIGYRFGGKRSGQRRLDLSWRVTARLLRVDRDGRVVRRVGRIGARFVTVTDVADLDFTFPGQGRGLYRLDLSFRRLGGRRLGGYREYFRVVRRTVRARLAASLEAVRPGETIYARVENLGTNDLNAKATYRIERFGRGGWRSIDRSVTPGTALDPTGLWWLAGGEAASCSEYAVPVDAAPGSYRFRTSVQPFGTRKRLLLTAPFTVSP